MELSNEARSVIGLMIVSIVTIEFGGYFLLSQLGRSNSIIRSNLQGSFFRAGHAHAGVLVILGILAQLLIDASSLSGTGMYLTRAGFFLPPILIAAGFFLSAPVEGRPGRLVILIYAGALILAVSLVVLGLTLLLG